MKTRWAGEVTDENAHQEYPRPQMMRDRWLCLNGTWEYAIVGEEKKWTGGRVDNSRDDLLLREPVIPASWDGTILVPFCPESELSGVTRLVRPDQVLWYRRQFAIPEEWDGQRVLLHFQAVDWHAVVCVNGERMGENRGGYVPFQFDITDVLKSGRPQEILVAVWDPSDVGFQGRGKQNLPETQRGYRYTPTTGIWQSVWLEPVPENHIQSLVLTPDLDQSRAVVEVDTVAAAGGSVQVILRDENGEVARAEGAAAAPVEVVLPAVRPWSPDDPFLYDVEVQLLAEGRVLDQIRSYLGMRKIDVGPDAAGLPQIRLNNEPLFQLGPLDQGYWPDGILTPPSDQAVIYDLQYLKDIGCNMVRAHVKVQPDRWYHHCDRLGLVVWQDTVCYRDTENEAGERNIAQWEEEQSRMIQHLANHPSIIMWTVFNEGWGQHDTERLTQWFAELDPTRVISDASGWWDKEVGQIYDVHNYSFHPAIPVIGEAGDRAVVIGEAGGFELLVPDHYWPGLTVAPSSDSRDDVHREIYADMQTFMTRYQEWVYGLLLLKAHGLNAVVYTQISDVEHEPNGWLTYDREVSKLPIPWLREVHERLYGAPPRLEAVEGEYRSRMGTVSDSWADPVFDDSDWTVVDGQPTDVLTGDLPLHWRYRFDGDAIGDRLVARFTGNGTAELRLGGRLIKRIYNERSDYTAVSDVVLPADDLEPGVNTLAVRFTAKFPKDNVKPREPEVRHFALQLLTMTI